MLPTTTAPFDALSTQPGFIAITSYVPDGTPTNDQVPSAATEASIIRPFKLCINETVAPSTQAEALEATVPETVTVAGGAIFT